MKYIVSLFFTYAIKWLRENPEQADELGYWLADKFIDKLPQAVDKLTDVFPGTLDDKLFDTLAQRFAKALDKFIPGLSDILKFIR